MNHDEKNRLFESWYQAYIKSHDVGNPAKYKEFARWAFWAGYEAAQHSVQRTFAICAAELHQKYGKE